MTYDPSSILRSYAGLDFTSLSLYRDLLSRPSTKPKKKENDRWKTAQGLDRLDEAIDFTGYGESLPICPHIERQSTETLHPCGRHLDHFPWKFSRTLLITQKICLLSCVSRRAYDGYPYHHLHFLPRVCMSISIYYIKSNPPLNWMGFARADVL